MRIQLDLSKLVHADVSSLLYRIHHMSHDEFERVPSDELASRRVLIDINRCREGVLLLLWDVLGLVQCPVHSAADVVSTWVVTPECIRKPKSKSISERIAVDFGAVRKTQINPQAYYTIDGKPANVPTMNDVDSKAYYAIDGTSIKVPSLNDTKVSRGLADAFASGVANGSALGKAYRELLIRQYDATKKQSEDMMATHMSFFNTRAFTPKQQINLDRVFVSKDSRTTTTLWTDGTRTKVKQSDADACDTEKAFLVTYFQKHSGLSKTQANKLLQQIVAGEV